MKINKYYILILIIYFSYSCTTEKEKCLSRSGLNEFQRTDDDVCLGAIALIGISNSQNNRGNSNLAENTSQAGNVFILECLRLNYEKSQCNKKSDIIPATW
ncbi:MAG: hypothetical protein O9346_10305 [Leptospiraceae bacterium]|nr:hypothetical protein [Leptospiraceae bacterium]MCZ8346798.1 hypothetical protein [Leptospiraceae bacterium]